MGFRGANRGQSEVIGALLIFAVIVAFIGLNQAFLVPQANEDVEFKHNNDVQRDIVDLRAATTEAAASNQPRSRTVALGTDYPSRFIAINPPPASGTVRTVSGDGPFDADHDDLDLKAVCGTDGAPDSKFLTYRPDYNEYQNALPMTVENTVTYRTTDEDPLLSTGQMFVHGEQINIIRYAGNVSETSDQTASLDLVPSKTGRTTVDTSNETLNMTIPTRLPANEWDRLTASSPVTPYEVDGRNRVKFRFEDDTTYEVQCTTVGINEKPDVNPQDRREAEETANFINPNRGGEIVLTGTEDVNKQDSASIMLRDQTGSDSPINITEARVNHYLSASSGGSGDVPDYITIGDTDLSVGGNLQQLEDPVVLNEGSETDVTLEFGGGNVQSEDFYVLTLGYSNGQTNVYFVSHRHN